MEDTAVCHFIYLSLVGLGKRKSTSSRKKIHFTFFSFFYAASLIAAPGQVFLQTECLSESAQKSHQIAQEKKGGKQVGKKWQKIHFNYFYIFAWSNFSYLFPLIVPFLITNFQVADSPARENISRLSAAWKDIISDFPRFTWHFVVK